MIKLKTETMKRMLSVHGWSGIVLGLLLYVVVLTGAIVVFSHEIGIWSVSGEAHQEPLSLSINEPIQRLAAQTPEVYHETLGIQPTPDGYVQVFFHTHKPNPEAGGQVEDIGVRYKFDPETGQVLDRQEGFESSLKAESASVLERFLLDLHINLHVPGKLGLYLTGILGLVLLVAAISGFLLHRHLFKDMFLSPRGGNPALTSRDKHNLAGTWGLPFSFVLAFTGAFFSFALSLGLPVIAMTAFGGDQQKALEVMVGVPEKQHHAPAAMTNLDDALSLAKSQENVPVVFASILYWGTTDAKMITFHDTPEGSLYADSHEISMVTGEYLNNKPSLGTVPSVGNDLVNLMGVLHFGMFAGLLSRLIWFALGIATCYVTLTGLQLWLMRRADTRWRKFYPVVDMVGYGLPISVATCALGFLLSYPASHTAAWTAWGFILGMVLSASTLLVKHKYQALVYQLLLGVFSIAAVAARGLISDIGWGELLAHDHAPVVGMDVAILLLGFGSLYLVLKTHQKLTTDNAIGDDNGKIGKTANHTTDMSDKPAENSAEENRVLADTMYDSQS